MYPWMILFEATAAVVMLFALAWCWACACNNYSLVDAFWAAGLAVTGLYFLWIPGELSQKKCTLAILFAFWSIRLSLHLTYRIAKAHPEEDRRYQQLRDAWKKHEALFSFLFFQAQALSVVFLTLPFFFIGMNRNPAWHFSEIAGSFLLIIGILGETIADKQLADFKSLSSKSPESAKNCVTLELVPSSNDTRGYPKNAPDPSALCRKGLWKYSRHPNYFFEILIWISFYCIALDSPYGWITLYAPATIIFLLLKVTGIPPAEASSLRSKGEAYRHYQQETSVLIPWFPKKPIDSFPNSTATTNCCVAPVLASSSASSTSCTCAPKIPCNLLASARFARSLIHHFINELLAQNLLPDVLIRFGIRKQLAKQLARFEKLNCEERQELLMKHLASLRESPIAIATVEANEQHYELPTAFFSHILGEHKKYSSGYWDEGVANLDEAEARMLELTCARAQLADGQKILELGCGWGSLTLWMAMHYPHADITAISNSQTQRVYIESQLLAHKLHNVTVRTVNMVDYLGEGAEVFDRVVSVEMLEHMKNYQQLFQRIADWLKPEGLFFAHIFTHRAFAYHYESDGEEDWIARYFFTGGQMPSDNLLLYFQEELQIEMHWQVSGTHYQKTAQAWLNNMDAARHEIMPLLKTTYGAEQQKRWWSYWRTFFMACEELWGYKKGNEWIVSHYLFKKYRGREKT